MSTTAVFAGRGTLPGLAGRYGVQAVVTLATVIVMMVVTPSFRGESAVYSIVGGFTLVGLVALGVAVTMVAGELDLSVASVAALGGVIAIRSASGGLVGSLVAATGACAVLGLIQGYAIARMRINSLVVTIGTSILISGVVWIISNEGPIQLHDFSVSDALLLRWWIFTPASALAVAVFVLVGVLLSRVRIGREIYAVGGGRAESAAAGVDVRRAVTLAFIVSGACAGLGGALVSLQSASAAPDAFPNLLLLAVAACLIGGVSLSGGHGSAASVVLGVVVVSAVNAGIAAKGSPSYVSALVTGVILIGIVLVQLLVAAGSRSSA